MPKAKVIKKEEVIKKVKKPESISEPIKEVVNEAKETKKEGILEPLQPGQKYFEAPDGTVIIGEADKQQIWYRAGNGGKGFFINPKR
jgi:hypothetical protein